MAMTADGKIATANRAVSEFSTARDRQRLLELRATADAVLTGARTVEAGPIHLGPGPLVFRKRRLGGGLAEYNLRIIASGSASLSPHAHIFSKRFSPVIVIVTTRAPKRRIHALEAVGAVVKCFGADRLNFRAGLEWLRRRWGVKRLVCEGGGELNGALFRAGFVDELRLTICPVIFGGRAAPTIADGSGVPRLARAAGFKLKSMKRAGCELFAVFCRVG